jgi:hypothetical protein
MLRKMKEYSLDELLEHPMLGVQITNGGIERRCLGLILDSAGGRSPFAQAERGERFPLAPERDIA